MTLPANVFTTEQARTIRDNEPTFSDRPNGVDLPTVLDNFRDDVQTELDELPKIISGTDTIALGTASKAVAIGAAYDGKPAVASVMQASADATLTNILRVGWDGSGNLTIYGNANATAAVTVSYIVDGR